MNEQQLPELPYCVAHILLGDDSENVFTADQMRDYAKAALAANVPAALPENETPQMHDAAMAVLYAGVARGNTNALWRAYRQALLAAAPAPEAARTAQEIVNQTEELAGALMLWAHRREAREGYGNYRDADDPRGKSCWQMACKAQEILTATDPENAVSELEDEPPAPAPEAKPEAQHPDTQDAERYRWLLKNYARGDGYTAIDKALNDGEPDTQLSPAIDAARGIGASGEGKSCA